MEKYDVLFPIGQGTYGKVLKAVNLQANKFVALKKMKTSESNPRISQIAEREIEILKTLSHPNIVCLEEVISSPNTINLIFEFVDNNLLEVIKHNHQKIMIGKIQSLLFQTAKALEYCHSQKIIHRDIKPENLLVSRQGDLKLCDFGFARSLENTEVLTEYVSTRWYRAPELLVQGQYSFGVDVWALGCLAYEIYTGQPLFPGSTDYETLLMIVKTCGNLPIALQKAFNNSPELHPYTVPKTSETSLNKKLSNFSVNLAEIIKKCLTVDPAERVSIEDLLKLSFFQENPEPKKRNFSNIKFKAGQFPNISPDRKKVSPLKENEDCLKSREVIGKKPEKLPIIRNENLSGKKLFNQIFVSPSKVRIRKAEVNRSYIKEEKKMSELVTDYSNYNLLKDYLGSRSRYIKVARDDVRNPGYSSKNLTKRHVGKLNFSFLAKGGLDGERSKISSRK